MDLDLSAVKIMQLYFNIYVDVSKTIFLVNVVPFVNSAMPCMYTSLHSL